MKIFFKKLLLKTYISLSSFSLYKYVTTIIICVIIFIIVLLIWGMNVVSSILSVIIGIIITSMLLNVLNAILLYIEDEKKVTYDYKILENFYETIYLHTLSFKTLLTSDEEIKFFYDVCYEHYLYDEIKIIINDEPNKHFQLNSLIENNFFELFKAHTGSYYRNILTVRLDSYRLDKENKELILSTSRSDFFKHLVTNRAVDYKLHKLLTLREIFEPGPNLTILEKAAFSNHIGIISFLFLKNDYLIITHRANNATISKNKITSSIATRLILKDYSAKLDTEALFINDIHNYLVNNLYLHEHNSIVKESRITFLGFGRDIYEGGKPHFYFTTHIDLSKEEYWDILKKNQPKSQNKKIDQIKKIYISNYRTFCSNGKKIGFEIYIKGKKDKKIFAEPEKSMLCNLWHYENYKKVNYPK
jgi:hypothetical protein